MVNLKNKYLVCETDSVTTPLDVLEDRSDSHGAPADHHDAERELPPLQLWPELTYYQMLRAFDWGGHYVAAQEAASQGVPPPPVFIFLDTIHLSDELLALTKRSLAIAKQIREHVTLPPHSPIDIPVWPGERFAIGTAMYNALLSQPENARFAELFAMLKEKWGDMIFISVRVFRRATDGGGGHLPAYAWQAAPNSDQIQHLRTQTWSRLRRCFILEIVRILQRMTSTGMGLLPITTAMAMDRTVEGAMLRVALAMARELRPGLARLRWRRMAGRRDRGGNLTSWNLGVCKEIEQTAIRGSCVSVLK